MRQEHQGTLKYRNYFKYSDHKLRMGPSESSFQSSRVPKVIGRASKIWSGARSARLTLGTRAHRAAFRRSARSKNVRQKLQGTLEYMQKR